MVKLGREPVLALIAVLGPLVALLLSLFVALPAGWATALNALAVAVAGLLTALVVRGDRLAPAILGVAQALLVCALGFGLAVTADQQAAVLVIVGLVVAAFVRGIVIAPVGPTPG